MAGIEEGSLTGQATAFPDGAAGRPTSRTLDGLALDVLHPPAPSNAMAGWREPARSIGIFPTLEHPDGAEAARQAAVDVAGGATGLNLALGGSVSARGFGLSLDGVAGVLLSVDPLHTAIRIEVPCSPAACDVERVFDCLGSRRHSTGLPGLELTLDPLGDAARSGRIGAGAPEASTTVWFGLAAARNFEPPTLRADGRPHHEAGASEVQELAAVLSTGVFHLRAMERAGLPDSRPAFTLAADADQLLTVAKFRAFRRLWALVEEACGLVPAPARLHAETSWRMLSRADPWTNVVRATLGCAGAVLGGADSVTVLPFTAAMGLPDTVARRLARNTPLVLLEESGLARVADPAAGSGAFEAWTDAFCRAAWSMFQDLEGQGGLAAALGSGAWQQMLSDMRQIRIRSLESQAAALVGVTAFVSPDLQLPAVLIPARPDAGKLPDGGAELQLLGSIRDATPFEHVTTPMPVTGG